MKNSGALLFLMIAVVLSAATALPPPVPLKEREQRSLYRQQQQMRATPAVPRSTPRLLPPLPESNASLPCVRIDRIVSPSITLIPQKDLDKIFRPWLHRCDTILDIGRLLRDLNNRYLQEGYVTSIAYLEPQDLSRGTLRISAMEGRIQDVVTRGIPRGFLFLGAEGTPLNLRDLEDSLGQLDRLRSWQTHLRILPGQTPGTSRVLVEGNRTRFPIYGSVALNNFGTRQTGRVQFEGSLTWENMLHLNDTLRLRFDGTGRQGPGNRSRDFTISWGLPIGKNYWEISYSGFEYRQPVYGQVKTYPSRGRTRTLSLSWERELFRSRRADGSLSLALERRRDENRLAGVRLDLSSHRLTILRLRYTQHFDIVGWQNVLQLTLRQGTSLWGAHRALGLPTQYTLGRLDAQASRWFPGPGGLPILLDLALHGQLGQRRIPGVEQISIGGPYSVRGFPSGGVFTGNSGFYLRGELSTTFGKSKWRFAPYLGLDIGAVRRNDVSYGGELAGGTLGLRLRAGDLSIDLFGSVPLKDSRPGSRLGLGRGVFGLRFGYDF